MIVEKRDGVEKGGAAILGTVAVEKRFDFLIFCSRFSFFIFFSFLLVIYFIFLYLKLE